MSRYPGAINLFEAGNPESLAAAISANLSRSVQERQAAASSARDRTAWPVVIEPVAKALGVLTSNISSVPTFSGPTRVTN